MLYSFFHLIPYKITYMMMHFRRSILQLVIITLVYNLYVCATPNKALNDCKDEMKNVFHKLNHPFLICVKYAIKRLALYDESGNIFSSYTTNVAEYYKSFIQKVSGDDIMLRGEYCGKLVKGTEPADSRQIQARINICKEELAIFGDSWEDILYNAMYLHSQQSFVELLYDTFAQIERIDPLSFIELIYDTLNPVARIEQRSSEGSKYKHTPKNYAFHYLHHISFVVKLLDVTPYVLSTHPNRSEVAINVQSTPNPEIYCIEIYGTKKKNE